MVENEDEIHKLIEEEYDNQQEGLDNIINPFQSWAEEISNKNKSSTQEGTGLNALYLPTLVPKILKCMKLLSLWSGLMIQIFGYGDETASSAAVESTFRKIKNVTFKNIDLPTNIENFIEHHSASLKGASLLRTSRYTHTSKSNNQNNALPVNLDDSIDFILSPIHHDNMDEPIDTYLVVSSNSTHQNNSTNYSSGCPLCNSGDFPSKNGSHKCNKCHVPVHALLSCSTHKQGNEEIRYCLKCSKNDEEINAAYLSEENKSVEGWNRKPKRQRNLNSYLCPNPNLRHLQINNSKNIQTLPLLKNGSRAQELKSCTIKNIGKVILSNTCAFDTISSILMVAICDSIQYCCMVNECDNIFYKFIVELVNNGISSKTYTNRAELMVWFKIYNYKITKVMIVKQKKKKLI